MEFIIDQKEKIDNLTNNIQIRNDLCNKLDRAFTYFFDQLNGEIDDVEFIQIVDDAKNDSFGYIFHKKLIVFNFQLNVVRRMNSFLRFCHQEINDGDLIVGKIELMEGVHKKLKERLPLFLYKLIISYEFIFKRFLPRIPVTNKIYEKFRLLSRQVLSKCEILGRLIYNGFDILEYREIDDELYFLCRRAVKPSDKEVNRGLIFKQPRIGKDGKVFNFLKFRTMHPYAEFLQSHLITINKFTSKGKLNNDFRIADWGKFLRKNWLDELPEIINLVKGDLRLFGVRPLSESFYSLYPEEIRKERSKMKPGLIPPYYADLPNSIEEVIESERKYLEKRKKAPFKTDVEYFLNAMRNILLNGARSA